jgi:hypothetical protein
MTIVAAQPMNFSGPVISNFSMIFEFATISIMRAMIGTATTPAPRHSRRRGATTTIRIVFGWTDALRRLHPGERIYTFWHYGGTPIPEMPGSASIICCSASHWRSVLRLPGRIERFAAAKRRAITPVYQGNPVMALRDPAQLSTP